MKLRKNEMKLRKKQIKVPKNFFVPHWLFKDLYGETPQFLHRDVEESSYIMRQP